MTLKILSKDSHLSTKVRTYVPQHALALRLLCICCFGRTCTLEGEAYRLSTTMPPVENQELNNTELSSDLQKQVEKKKN